VFLCWIANGLLEISRGWWVSCWLVGAVCGRSGNYGKYAFTMVWRIQNRNVSVRMLFEQFT